MNSKEQIQHCRKKSIALAKELERLRKERAHCISNLHILNSKYSRNEIDYESYSRLWNSILTDLRYYERYTQQLSYLLREQEIELASTEDKESSVQLTKALSITLITVLLLLAGLGTLNIPVIPGITGYAGAEANTSTLAEIQEYFSIDLSDVFDAGVTFTLPSSPLGTRNSNATDNYNGTNSTQYWVTLAADSNVEVDICTRASSNLTYISGATYIIEVHNLSWANSTASNNITIPDLATATRYNFTYTPATEALDIGNNSYYRLWIDIPEESVPGTYNNSIIFSAIKTDLGASKACPTSP